MFGFKNTFIVIIIVAILLGGATGLYLAKTKKIGLFRNNTAISTSSGASAEKVGEVIKKINGLTND